MIEQLLVNNGVGVELASNIAFACRILFMAMLAFFAKYITEGVILNLIKKFIKKSKTDWDDTLLENRVFHRFSHLAPTIVFYLMAPYVFDGHVYALSLMWKATYIYLTIVGLLVLDALLDSVVSIYNKFDVSRRLPIRGFLQVVRIVLFVLACIIMLTILFGAGSLKVLGSLGAFTAVLMLVFKDAILGFVAGIQLTANDMVHIGDWIEMPKYGADGDVIDISLTTVKVQNWDKTISTIPAYGLISDSFKNWRGMSESAGRRIKRSVNIDTNSIKFCDEKMIAKFKKFQFIKEYIEQKEKDITDWNTEEGVDASEIVNGRRMTNVGVLRAYITEYLRHNANLNKDMTMMVRQLEPTAKGLPIQIYTFCTDKRWVYYEGIQSDIFDHILAVIPQFELKVYQQPAGTDFDRFGQTAQTN